MLLGISAYLGDLPAEAELLQYLEGAEQRGYDLVFTSLHIPESQPWESACDFRILTRCAERAGMSLVADVDAGSVRLLAGFVGSTSAGSPRSLRALRESGITGIRLDLGFSIPETIDLLLAGQSDGVQVIANASMITAGEAAQLARAGAKVSAWHNFYPRPETGLSLSHFRDRSMYLQSLGFQVGAFVPCLARPRGPLSEGLPTIEAHRHAPPGLAAMEMLATGAVDVIVFGDPMPPASCMQEVRDAVAPETVVLRVLEAEGVTERERDLAYLPAHLLRLDDAELVFRSETSRKMASAGALVPARPALPRPRFSVTVDNERYARYSGEVQITRRDLPPDPRINVFGRIVEEDQVLAGMLRPGNRFELRPL